MSWAPDYYDRTQSWEWPHTGYYNLGPVTIPPRLPFTGLVDRATGQTWFVGQNGSTVVLQPTQPVAINVKVYQPFDGPFLPYGCRLGVASGTLVLDIPGALGTFESNDFSSDFSSDFSQGTITSAPLKNISGGNASAPIWIYNVNNPLQQSYPEPTNIPTLLPVPVPGVPSSSPAPTGGGFKAFNDAMQARVGSPSGDFSTDFSTDFKAQIPGFLGPQSPFLTIILTAGMIANLAWWNGSAWVSPAGVALTNIIGP
jgi:hypothetical protein